MPSPLVVQPLVSIVLVTRNGAGTLPATLEAIDSQVVDFRFEIVAVDSGSTDGTAELLKNTVDTLVAISPADFDHGMTRNAAVERSRGELVVFIVQDALPVSSAWLSTLVRPFHSDPHLAGTFCRQRPRPEASAVTRHYLSRWFASGEEGRRVVLGRDGRLDELSPLERLDRCTFDNVCSCIRRSVWLAHPFASTPIAEDVQWADTVLRAGYAIEYVPDAVVVHSHDRSAAYEFARTYTLHLRLFELFGVRTVPTLGSLIRAVAASARLHLHCTRSARPRESVRAMVRALLLAVAWPAGQYLGALSAVKRWSPLRFRGV